MALFQSPPIVIYSPLQDFKYWTGSDVFMD